MKVKGSLLQGCALLVVLLSTVVSAENNKKESSVIPSAEIQEGEVVHVIKLKDILQGKYSKEKNTSKEEQKKEGVSSKKPATDKMSVVAVKPATTSDSIDIEKAFAAVMGYNNQPAIPDRSNPKVTQQQVNVQQAKKTAPSANGPSTGWLYLGKFSQGQWDQKNNQVLGLNGTLPIVGQPYVIRVFSNVRKAYPSKKGMPPIVKVLPQGRKIRLLGLHNSGHSGHYWAHVQWF